MRYLHAVAMCEIGGIGLIGAISQGIGWRILAVSAACGLIAGIPVGLLMAKAMSRHLIAGEWKSPSRLKGCAFFILIGVVGFGTMIAILTMGGGVQGLQIAGIGALSMGAAVFGVAGVSVWRLERRFQARVVMWPDGLWLEKDSSEENETS